MNIINDPWLFVEYLDGTKTQVSIRQAFIDAKKIKNIDTPVFHNTKVSIYEVPVIQLLATILEAVYFKPETNFQASSKYFSKKLLQDGWDIQIILGYLDKWQDRFNLFDEKYPFMQDTILKPENIEESDNLGYISRLSVVAPGGNNLIFENNSDKVNDSYLAKYRMTEDELVYILLYTRVMGTSPMAKQYPNKSICANTTLFILNYGKTLFETILFNCLPLRTSEKSEELFDKPVWELDDYSDIKNYNIENLYKNTLLCTFFPIIPAYVVYNNGIKDILLSKDIKDCIFDKETKNSIISAYCLYNPWAIRTIVNDGEQEFAKYKEWTNNTKLVNLCIDITKQLPSGIACNIINNTIQENKNAQCNIYYRQYDGMKANVLSYGKYIVSQDILDILQDDLNHNKAIQFQNITKRILDKFNEFKNSGIPNYIVDKCKLEFSKYTEQYFFNTFIYNITNNDIILQTIDNLIKYAKQQVKKLDAITNNPLKYAIAYKIFSGSLNKLKEENDEQCAASQTDIE